MFVAWFSIYRRLALQPFLPSDLFRGAQFVFAIWSSVIGAIGTFLHENVAGHFANRYDQIFLSPCCDCPGWKDPTTLSVLVTGVSEWSELSVDEKSYEDLATSGDQRSAPVHIVIKTTSVRICLSNGGASKTFDDRTRFRFTTSRNVWPATQATWTLSRI